MPGAAGAWAAATRRLARAGAGAGGGGGGVPAEVRAEVAGQGARLPRFWHEGGGGGGLAVGAQAELAAAEAVHAGRTLRLKPGARLELCDGRGGLQEAEVLEAARGRVRVAAVTAARTEAWVGPRLEVVVAGGTLKGSRGDWLVEKCCELGAVALQPLVTARSPSIGKDKGASAGPSGREQRWRRVAQAAAKQSLRAHGMAVEAPISVGALAARIAAAPLSLVAAAGGTGLAEALRGVGDEALRDGPPGLLVVGPEGDFTAEELEVLAAAGSIFVGLGERRLRTETAAMSMLSTSMLLLGG